jgi:membrane-bound ClpP family serine protease
VVVKGKVKKRKNRERRDLLMCHIILAFPILALPLFFFFPLRTAVPAYAAVLLVTAFLYFKIISALKSKVQTGLEAVIDEEALVIEDIDPEGKITFWSEIWKATAEGKKFRKGEKVRIYRFSGLEAVVGQPLGPGRYVFEGKHHRKDKT